MSVLPQSRFDELQKEIAADTQPATAVERWLVDEIVNAKWELERVRANSSNTAAESRLNDAYSRATRNWNRARKELQAVHTARVNHLTKLPEHARSSAAGLPLADPARTPLPGPVSGAMTDTWIEAVKAQAANEMNQAFESMMGGK